MLLEPVRNYYPLPYVKRSWVLLKIEDLRGFENPAGL